MSTTEQWYISQRAEALTRVLLTRRNDLILTPLQDEEHGLDYRAEITSNNQVTGRIFGIQVKARVQALQQSAYVRLNGSTTSEVMSPTFPVCLFFFTMEDNGAYYRWLIEPVLTEDQSPKLIKVNTARLERLNSEEVDRIVARVNTWYDGLYKTLSL